MKKEWSWTLKQKEESKRLIKEAVQRFGPHKIGLAWSGGKDSTTVLRFTREARWQGIHTWEL